MNPVYRFVKFCYSAGYSSARHLAAETAIPHPHRRPTYINGAGPRPTTFCNN